MHGNRLLVGGFRETISFGEGPWMVLAAPFGHPRIDVAGRRPTARVVGLWASSGMVLGYRWLFPAGIRRIDVAGRWPTARVVGL